MNTNETPQVVSGSQNISLKSPIVGRLSAGLALISVLFLPLGGCQGHGITGIEALQSDHIEEGIKLLLAVCLVCAGIALIARPPQLCFAAGIGGIVTLLIAYSIVHDKIPIDMMLGSYLAIGGFLGVIAEGVIQTCSVIPDRQSS